MANEDSSILDANRCGCHCDDMELHCDEENVALLSDESIVLLFDGDNCDNVELHPGDEPIVIVFDEYDGPLDVTLSTVTTQDIDNLFNEESN